MDLKSYYQKVRKWESELPEGDVIVVSLETRSDGRAGLRTEVPKRTAAKLLTDGAARLATAEEAEQFLAEKAEAKRTADDAAAAARVHLSLIPRSELDLFRESMKRTEK